MSDDNTTKLPSALVCVRGTVIRLESKHEACALVTLRVTDASKISLGASSSLHQPAKLGLVYILMVYRAYPDPEDHWTEGVWTTLFAAKRASDLLVPELKGEGPVGEWTTLAEEGLDTETAPWSRMVRGWHLQIEIRELLDTTTGEPDG